jgi:hypothetical protein
LGHQVIKLLSQRLARLEMIVYEEPTLIV